MKSVKIVDYYAIKTFHEVINYSFLRICSSLFRKVTYVSGKSAQTNIQNMDNDRILINVEYKTMPTIESDTSWGSRLRDIWGIFTTIYHYLFTYRDSLLLYNYTNYISLPLILGLNILLRKKIIFVFHGELEFLASKISYLKRSGWHKLFMMLSFRFLFHKSPAYALVLGDSIRNNLLKLYPQPKGHVLSICHPYIVDNKPSEKSIEMLRSMPVRIGTVGVMKREKGLDNLITLSLKLKDLISSQKLELFHIGKTYAPKEDFTKEINWIGKGNFLSRQEFENQIQKLDYLLYLYPTNSYSLTASGAIMDAIRYHKPIIALHNDYFDYLMKEHAIGYMGNTIEDLELIIRQIISGKLYYKFNKEIGLLSEKVSIENNTILLKKELDKIL